MLKLPCVETQVPDNTPKTCYRSHVASNKHHSLHRDLCNTWQLSQFITQLDNKFHINTQKLVLVFYQTIGVQQKFNTEFLQLPRLDFIHFILMHSQTSQFQFHVKINSQEYSNPIPSDFEPIITHQVPIRWIFNKQPCNRFKRLKITNESCSIPKYKLH